MGRIARHALRMTIQINDGRFGGYSKFKPRTTPLSHTVPAFSQLLTMFGIMHPTILRVASRENTRTDHQRAAASIPPGPQATERIN